MIFVFHDSLTVTLIPAGCVNLNKISNLVTTVIKLRELRNHLVSFHNPTLQMFILTSGSLTRLIYELLSDCQYRLFLFILICNVFLITTN